MPISMGVPSSLAPTTDARTALPQPPNTSQNVPMNSATPRFQSFMGVPSPNDRVHCRASGKERDVSENGRLTAALHVAHPGGSFAAAGTVGKRPRRTQLHPHLLKAACPAPTHAKRP